MPWPCARGRLGLAPALLCSGGRGKELGQAPAYFGATQSTHRRAGFICRFLATISDLGWGEPANPNADPAIRQRWGSCLTPTYLFPSNNRKMLCPLWFIGKILGLGAYGHRPGNRGILGDPRLAHSTARSSVVS